MSEKIQDTAVQIWAAQNDLCLEYGIDVISRSFCIARDIDADSFAEIDAKLSILERGEGDGVHSPITIKINSCGGSVHDAWAIVARIKRSPCQITTEAYGAVYSAATMIFAAGAVRKVSRYCEFMFHATSVSEVAGQKHSIKSVMTSMDREEQLYCKLLEENSNKSRRWWKKLLDSKRDVYLTAEQVLKLGLTEEIF